MSDDQALKHYSASKTAYISHYNAELLVSIPRQPQRSALGIEPGMLPFNGVDIWNAFEFTWLNAKGKPEVAVAQIKVPADSRCIIESKSLKLYLGSFSNTRFSDTGKVVTTLESDLAKTAGATVAVTLMSAAQSQQAGLYAPQGKSLDVLDIEVDEYDWNPDLLVLESDEQVRESLYTHLFRSVCPITSQPDFASLIIHYSGKQISQAGLLRYLISYREHAEFGEQIIERIFVDLMKLCEPDELDIQARFTRRGGIDINPCRSLGKADVTDLRMWRQ